MSAELLQNHWALLLAAAIALLVALFLLAQKVSESAPAQLRRVRKALAYERARSRRAERAVARAEGRLRRLEHRAESAKPSLVQETKEALEDAKALVRIAQDQVMIAENHVRRVILEEFAPAKQQCLREKYLVEAPAEKRPFSF